MRVHLPLRRPSREPATPPSIVNPGPPSFSLPCQFYVPTQLTPGRLRRPTAAASCAPPLCCSRLCPPRFPCGNRAALVGRAHAHAHGARRTAEPCVHLQRLSFEALGPGPGPGHLHSTWHLFCLALPTFSYRPRCMTRGAMRTAQNLQRRLVSPRRDFVGRTLRLKHVGTRP
jgi:hypothetical protein